MAEIARHTLKHEFRQIDPSDAQILLVEAGDRVLAAYPPDLSEKAQQSLERLGVVVRTKTMVADVAADHVLVKFGGARRTIANANGGLGGRRRSLAARRSAGRSDRCTARPGGRIVVEPDLSLPEHPEIFVLGDMANYSHQDGKPLPGVAPVAIQQGRFVAKLINARLRGRPLPTFRYRDLGNLATIGRSAAVADFGKLHFSGFLAWMMWLVIHLMNLVSFRNRLLVLVQWGWNYFTYDRSARSLPGRMKVTTRRSNGRRQRNRNQRSHPKLLRLNRFSTSYLAIPSANLKSTYCTHVYTSARPAMPALAPSKNSSVGPTKASKY